MPIYEFFCADCNTVFNFFSSRPNTDRRPDCPKCGRKELQKMVSTFATIGKAKEGEGDDPLAGLDEAKMEQAKHVNEDDPRQMARLMRKFMDKTGLSLGGQMEEAIARMESGDDPEEIERDMGELMDGDEPFTLEAMKKKAQAASRKPVHDDTLYEL
jgi:putative FmdB family regulatory protein